MRILALTTLYPSAERPAHGVFVENRLRALTENGHDIRVVAPVPRFPSRNPAFGTYAKFARTPKTESRHGIQISHPRYTLIPKVGMTAAAHALTNCFADAIAAAIADGFVPDLIDAHYYYPDGVAAVEAAERFRLPVTVTARGTDVNLIPKFPRQRAMVLAAAANASASITVAEALRKEMVDLGADGAKITAIRNGVDLAMFHPPKAAPSGPLTLASVGLLTARKGHDFTIRALTMLPSDSRLLIAGQGEEEGRLKALCRSLGVADRVTFLGEVPHGDLATKVYGKAHITVLASSREGWPNVLLESMACGTPCVATDVWGSGEVISSPDAGRLSKERSAEGLADAITSLKDNLPDRAATRRHAEAHGWGPVARSVESVWTKAVHDGWGSPQAVPEGLQNRFLLTVDTEEVFDWSTDPTTWTLPPVAALDTLQATAETAGIVPLYFVTYPLIQDPELGGRLAEWVRAGRASVGLHLHAWSTPPDLGAANASSTFQCNLDPEIHRAKLSALIEAFTSRFDTAPTAHRAGRYGAAPWVLNQLADAGITYDFSPSAGFDATAAGGPDFTTFGNALRYRSVGTTGQWVIPVSGARKWRGTRMFTHCQGPIARSATKVLRKNTTVGVRLSPEGHTPRQMDDVTAHLLAHEHSFLTPSLHLTSLAPGATPYAADADGVLTIQRTLSAWFATARVRGLTPATIGDVEAALTVPPREAK